MQKAGLTQEKSYVRLKSEECAIIFELKWDKSVETAISQIHEKNYPQSLEDYSGNILLVGINYNKTDKEDKCVIEEWLK